MPEVTFLTGNKVKFAIAEKIFREAEVLLHQADLDLPEMQSLSVEEVASHAALAGCARLGRPVMKSDVGYYIDALNGFPGPFIKFVNQTLTAENLLALMAGQSNRTVRIRDCLALAVPGQAVRCFHFEYAGQIGHVARGEGTPINQVLYLDGSTTSLGESTSRQMLAFWVDHLQHYHELARYLKAQAV